MTDSQTDPEKRAQQFKTLYHDARDEQHVFIFSACGRASTTAFQRILNSSGEIMIWGEGGGLISVLAGAVRGLEKKKRNQCHHAKTQ